MDRVGPPESWPAESPEGERTASPLREEVAGESCYQAFTARLGPKCYSRDKAGPVGPAAFQLNGDGGPEYAYRFRQLRAGRR